MMAVIEKRKEKKVSRLRREARGIASEVRSILLVDLWMVFEVGNRCN